MEKKLIFESPRQFSKRGIIPEAATRRLIRAGRVPGFYSGSKYLINTYAFIQMLEQAGTQQMKGEDEND